MVVELYGHQTFGSSFGPNVERNLSEHLQTLTQTEGGSRQLKRLLDCLIKVSGQLKNEKWGSPSAMREAAAIGRLLNEDLSARPEFVVWAKARLAEADVALIQPTRKDAAVNQGASVINGSSTGRSPLDAVTALDISQILKDSVSQPLLLGLLESPYPSNADLEKQLTEAFERLARLHPQEMAAAIELHFERMWLFADVIVQNRVRPAGETADRVRLATQTLLANTKNRQKLLETLKQAKVWGSPQSIFGHDDVDALIKQLEAN